MDKLKLIICDICLSKNLVVSYTIPNSLRGNKVYICKNCGLIHSKNDPEYDQTKNHHSLMFNDELRIRKPDSGPTWGNIRHGKELRFNSHKKYLYDFDFKRIKYILDDGSNRGSFLKWVSTQTDSNNIIIAIEPDKSIVDYNNNLPKNVKFQFGYLEDIKFNNIKFDFIYSSHTFEHVNSIYDHLLSLDNISKMGTIMFVDMPNADDLNNSLVIEEFFVDKHNFHYFPEYFNDLMYCFGYTLINDFSDSYNITSIYKKTNKKNIKQRLKGNYFGKSISLVKTYKKNLNTNLKSIRKVCEYLNEILKTNKVCFYGGGRIFDSLIVNGGLEKKNIEFVVDNYLSKYLNEIQGIKQLDSKIFDNYKPDIVIILARSSAKEIEESLKEKGINNFIRFYDLLDKMKNRI